MCWVSEIWQADRLEVSGVVLSGAWGVLAEASMGRGVGSGILFEAKAKQD